MPTSAAANGKVALVVECVELKARLRKPPGGNASSTRCGKSRSFIRLVISDLRHVIERRGRMTTGRARTLMQLRGGSWEAPCVLRSASVEGDAKRYEPLALGSPTRRSTNERVGPRTAHGNGTAFSAVAPSERPVLPSIDPIFGSGIPQARIFIQHSGRLSGSAFCGPDPHCLTLCDPFATYRRVTR